MPRRLSVVSGKAAKAASGPRSLGDSSWPLAVLLADPSKCLSAQNEGEFSADEAASHDQAAEPRSVAAIAQDDSSPVPSFFVAETAFDCDEDLWPGLED